MQMFRAISKFFPSLTTNNAVAPSSIQITSPEPSSVTMRLRLRIERNGLPPTQTLWPIDTTDPRLTIAQLVQNINDTFPLESDTWGLEDYSVSVGGYDCLHYHELQNVCKDDDEVVVRPLQWADVRARTLTGRSQISSDGRRLVDGIPFGRAKVRDPARPEVRIPPRKRRRLNEEADVEETTVDGDEEDDEDEDDEEFDLESSEEEESSSDASSDEVEDEGSSDDDSSDASSSEEESWDGLSPSVPASPTKQERQSLSHGVSESEQASQQTTSTSKRKRGSEDEEMHAEASSPGETGLPFQGRPETKARNVRRREANRLKRLKNSGVLPADATIAMMRELDANSVASKEANIGANSADVHIADGSDLAADAIIAEAPVSTDRLEEQLAKAEEPTASAGQGKKRAKKAKDQLETDSPDTDEFQQRRQKLLADIEAGGVEVSRLPSQKETSTPHQLKADTTMEDKAAVMLDAASTPTPRSRLNLASSARLVFGSLGVRVPKTQEEKDALQKKLAQRPTVNAHRSTSTAQSPDTNGSAAVAQLNGELDAAQTGVAEEDHWSAKINLTAVECCDDGVVLSTPPFPFYQRWDPQQRKKKNRTSSSFMEKGKAGKKRKREDFVETYDKYNSHGGGDALEYDDAEDGVEDEHWEDGAEDEYWEDGALLDDDDDGMDAEDEGRVKREDDSDNFPELPDNTDSLPMLAESDAQNNDFITFTELTCDDSTNWQPKMITRTAQIIRQHEDWPEDNSWLLHMSTRDRPKKTFDAEGKRVYSKFEMPEDDEDEMLGDYPNEGMIRTSTWEELGVVKLLLRGKEGGDE